MSKLRPAISVKGHLLLDGAMGTELFQRGLESGDPPEVWNVEQPDKVKSIYQAYVDAGSEIFLTNSFGGTHFRLALHNNEDRVHELNQAAAQLGREVADATMAAEPGRQVLVAGSMGPTGELLEPMGSMTVAACAEGFAEQAKGLADGGADILWIETMSSLEELEAAVVGARTASALPICATMSFDTAGRSMMGVTGTQLAELAIRLELDGVGANCGNNLADTEQALLEMAAVSPDLVLISKANAGMPEWKGADLHYSGTPELMAGYAHRAKELGVSIMGGCCGSEPAHIEHMRRVLDGEAPVPEIDLGVASTPGVAKKRTNRRRRG